MIAGWFILSPVSSRQFGRLQIFFSANMDDFAVLKFESDKSPKALLGKALEIVEGGLIGAGHWIAAFLPRARRRSISTFSITTRRPILTCPSRPSLIKWRKCQWLTPRALAASFK